MISKIPTFSFKNILIKKDYVKWSILGISIISIGLISNIWLTLIIALSLYIISIVYTLINSIKKI